ncbi:MAG: protein kinase domain-containing protein, partial [Acidimicrobiales bacterium]
MSPHAMTPAIPTIDLLAGRYRLEGVLGHGGMADVYRAIDERDGQAVAVKLVRSTDPELARRLTQEAKAVRRLEHPGLVRLLDAGVHDTQAFLVIELVEGPPLAARL